MRRNLPLEREDGFQEREVKCQNETHIRPTPLASASETCWRAYHSMYSLIDMPAHHRGFFRYARSSDA